MLPQLGLNQPRRREEATTAAEQVEGGGKDDYAWKPRRKILHKSAGCSHNLPRKRPENRRELEMIVAERGCFDQIRPCGLLDIPTLKAVEASPTPPTRSFKLQQCRLTRPNEMTRDRSGMRLRRSSNRRQQDYGVSTPRHRINRDV